MKAATFVIVAITRNYRISIHAAREGGDFTHYGYAIHKVISIHAAREGGDERAASHLGTHLYFNPRRP